jgi:hypothetical protein
LAGKTKEGGFGKDWKASGTTPLAFYYAWTLAVSSSLADVTLSIIYSPTIDNAIILHV